MQQTATEPDDLSVVSNNGRMADQIVRLAFDFARAEVELTSKQGNPVPTQEQSAGSSQYSSLPRFEPR